MPSQTRHKHSGNGVHKEDTSKMAKSSHPESHLPSMGTLLAFGAGLGIGALLMMSRYEQRPTRADLERFGEEAWDTLARLKASLGDKLHG